MNLLFIFIAFLFPASSQQSDTTMLIDDFKQDAGLSALGTRWNFFADTVMGGISRGRARLDEIENERCLRLTGKVSLENNGGFIQAALPLTRRGSFNAEAFEGVRIRVRGNGERYYIHIRTNQTRLPWMYFSAPFETTSEWKYVEIPFSAFVFENGRGTLNKSDVRRIAIVAAKRAFEADVAVSRIELYRKGTLSSVAELE